MKILRNLMIIFGVALLFTACQPTDVDPAGSRGEAAVPGIKNLNPATYEDTDLENTFVKFDLTMPEGATVDEAVLLVSYNKGGERKEVQRISSFPANGITVPLTSAASALGLGLESIKAADVFNFEVMTIEGGKEYFSSAAFNVAVVCGYDVDVITGDYTASSASWDMEGPVTITVDPDDEYIVYVHGLADAEGMTGNGTPFTFIINPLDYSITAPKATIADSMEPLAPYTGYSYAGSGSLNTCDGTYRMMFAITVDQGSFGSFEFVFSK